jgi:hypothetical protein
MKQSIHAYLAVLCWHISTTRTGSCSDSDSKTALGVFLAGVLRGLVDVSRGLVDVSRGLVDDSLEVAEVAEFSKGSTLTSEDTLVSDVACSIPIKFSHLTSIAFLFFILLF